MTVSVDLSSLGATDCVAGMDKWDEDSPTVTISADLSFLDSAECSVGANDGDDGPFLGTSNLKAGGLGKPGGVDVGGNVNGQRRFSLLCATAKRNTCRFTHT